MPALHSHILPLALPSYDFAGLAVGDQLVVPLNRRDPLRVWQEVAAAARCFRKTRNPRFCWRTRTDRSWLYFERTADTDIAQHLQNVAVCHRRRAA